MNLNEEPNKRTKKIDFFNSCVDRMQHVLVDVNVCFLFTSEKTEETKKKKNSTDSVCVSMSEMRCSISAVERHFKSKWESSKYRHDIRKHHFGDVFAQRYTIYLGHYRNRFKWVKKRWNLNKWLMRAHNST